MERELKIRVSEREYDDIISGRIKYIDKISNSKWNKVFCDFGRFFLEDRGFNTYSYIDLRDSNVRGSRRCRLLFDSVRLESKIADYGMVVFYRIYFVLSYKVKNL